MAMQYLENEFRKQGKGDLADIIASVHKLNGSDVPFPSVATVVKETTIQTFSKDQLILPETQIPQEVSAILQRAEKAGLTFFEPYRLSGLTLNKDSNVDGWDKKPEDSYWGAIKNGNVSQDAPKLPDAWVLIDKTQKPDYRDGKQMYEKDPLGTLIARLRKTGKIQKVKGTPEASRFRISHDELFQVVLPEIANLLGVEASQVRLPKIIEFNVMGNLKHPEWGTTNTWEWFDDKFGGGRRLIGGRSDVGGLASVSRRWRGAHYDDAAFRPLVVVSPKV